MSRRSLRYFVNTLPHGGSFDQMMQRKRVEDFVATIKQKFIPSSRTVDGGIYVGVAGVAYMYYHLSKISALQDLKSIYLQSAKDVLQLPLQEAQNVMHSGHVTDKTGFMTGNVGVYAVAAVIFNKLGNVKEADQCLVYFRTAWNLLKPLNWFKNGGDELFVGRAGILCSLFWLRKELSLEVIPDEDAFAMLDTIIESGKKYSASVHSPCPLMFHYYNVQYFGAAHGLVGILFVLLGYTSWLQNRPEAADLIKTSIDQYLHWQTPDGNFPSAADDISGRPPEEELVHWCHGAPGTVYVLARMYKVFQEEKYLAAALKCGEVTWKKGLLRKGPGICHGVAGSGYVFLVLYQLTNDVKHLQRAQQFMNFIFSDEFKEARTPDAPYSLFEGLAGTACFAGDLLDPQRMSFPFFDI